jgi:O-methyltransferase involved in polyketide biosynthesis
MLQHQPSRTAECMAMFRASEHAKGAGRRVFTDPLAVALLPGSLRLSAKLLAVRPVGEMLNRYIDRQWPGVRTSGIARTRLIDDWIGESIGSGRAGRVARRWLRYTGLAARRAGFRQGF